MKLEDIKFKYPRYRVTDMKIIVGSEDPFPVPRNMISSIYLEKDFDNAIFPFFEIQVGLPGWLHQMMKKDSQNISVSLSMGPGMFEKELKSGGVSSEITGTFYAIIPDTQPDMTEDDQIKFENEMKTYKKSYAYGEMAIVNMALYNMSYYHGSAKLVNAVLSSSNLTDALTYVLNNAGISNVLMSPPSNQSSYSEFKITPIKASKQILRICNQFKFHQNGSIVFFDLNKCYILDKSAKCSAWETNEYKTTHLMAMRQYSKALTTGVTGCYVDGKDKFNLILLDTANIVFEDKSNINANTSGNGIVLIGTTTGAMNTINATKGSDREASISQTYIYDDGEDTGKAAGASLAQDKKLMTVGINYCTLAMLAPNKLFQVTIDDPKFSKFNGKYRISKYSCNFSSEGEYWVPNIVAQFKGE